MIDWIFCLNMYVKLWISWINIESKGLNAWFSITPWSLITWCSTVCMSAPWTRPKHVRWKNQPIDMQAVVNDAIAWNANIGMPLDYIDLVTSVSVGLWRYWWSTDIFCHNCTMTVRRVNLVHGTALSPMKMLNDVIVSNKYKTVTHNFPSLFDTDQLRLGHGQETTSTLLCGI